MARAGRAGAEPYAARISREGMGVRVIAGRHVSPSGRS
jgi:hypothetical protein